MEIKVVVTITSYAHLQVSIGNLRIKDTRWAMVYRDNHTQNHMLLTQGSPKVINLRENSINP